MNQLNGNLTLDEDRIRKFLGAFPDEFIHLRPQEQRISAQIYRLLAETGQPVSFRSLAQNLNLPVSEVQQVLDDWTGLFYDDENRIVGYWGLALGKTPHRFAVNGHTLYTWCSWDSLFIPQVIGRTAQVESLDPLSKEDVRLTVSPEGVEQVEPGSAVTSFMIPETDHIRSDVIKSFCHYLHFFASRETAENWVEQSAKSSDLLILSIEEAFRIGLEKNQLQYPDILESEAAIEVV